MIYVYHPAYVRYLSIAHVYIRVPSASDKRAKNLCWRWENGLRNCDTWKLEIAVEMSSSVQKCKKRDEHPIRQSQKKLGTLHF